MKYLILIMLVLSTYTFAENKTLEINECIDIPFENKIKKIDDIKTICFKNIKRDYNVIHLQEIKKIESLYINKYLSFDTYIKIKSSEEIQLEGYNVVYNENNNYVIIRY